MLIGIFVVGALIQVAGTFVWWFDIYLTWQEAGLDPFSVSASWGPQYLVIPGSIVRLADLGTWQVAWLRLLRAGGAFGWTIVVFTLALVGASLSLM